MKEQYNGLVKWTIIQKDPTIKPHVFYTEEEFKCICKPNENKTAFKHSQFNKFLGKVNAIYTGITKRWMKMSTVTLSYKDCFGDQIAINDELSYYCFLRNVAEILNPPLEITLKDFIEEMPLPNLTLDVTGTICNDCDGEMICPKCDKQDVTTTIEEFVPDTPVSLTTDLENALNMDGKQNIKLWKPETLTETSIPVNETVKQKQVNTSKEIPLETPQVEETMQLVDKQVISDEPEQIKRQISQFSEWSSDFILEDPSETSIKEIQVEVEVHEQNTVTHENHKTNESDLIPQHTSLPSSFAIDAKLLANQEVFDLKNDESLEMIKPLIDPKFSEWRDTNKIINRPKYGYIDLDQPPLEEESSYNSVDWKPSARAKFMKKMSSMMIDQVPAPITKNYHLKVAKIISKSSTERAMGQNNSETAHEELNVEATSPAPSEKSFKSQGKGPLKRNIPLPRPIRTK